MLAVAGGKGGCGKTTTTLGLALAAGRRGRSVLAVDADVDVPDLHRVAGVEPPDRVGLDGFDRHDGVGPTDTTPRSVPGADGVSVLAAGPGTAPGSLRDRLRGTADAYDLVVVDCPAGGGRDAAVPLRAADRTVLVTTAREPSLRDAAKTGAMARAVGTPIAGAVVTRADVIPDGVGALLGTSAVGAVPTSEFPLRDRSVQGRYRRILSRVSTI